MTNKPKVGVSQCLLGNAVRYDGQSKPCAIVIDQLAELFELIPVCPEVEAGLSIPRPPVQLSGSIEQPRLIGRDNPDIDITELMQNYCLNKVSSLNQLNGFIFKSRSPSCGLHSSPVFINGQCITEKASGVFAHAIQTSYPNLPIIEETLLKSDDAFTCFMQAVLNNKRK